MKLNAKSLELLIKKGLGTAQIAEEVNVEQAELFDAIHRVFSESAAKAYCRRIARNDKKLHKNVILSHEEENKMGEGSVVTVSDEPVVTTLADLVEQEHKLQELTANQEVIAKTYVQNYRGILAEVTSKNQVISTMLQSFAQLRAEIEDLKTRADQILEEHLKSLDKLHEFQGQLQAVRDEISRRAVVNVFAYEDGTIEIEDSSIVTDFDGWTDVRVMIEEQYDDQISCLQLRQIKQLAKLICLPKLEDGRKFDITFDVSTVGEIYTQIINAV